MRFMPPTLDYLSPLPQPSRVQDCLQFLLRIIRNERVRRWAMGATCVLGLLAVAGVVSSSVSKGECERRTARSLGKGPFYVLPEHAAESLPIFHAAGIWPKQAATIPDAVPWGGIKHAHSPWPFIVEVDYAGGTYRQAGRGERRRFFCLFGHVFEIGESMRWTS